LRGGGNDRVVKIWNTADGKPVSELKGHELEVRKFDGKDLHTCSSGQHVHLWRRAQPRRSRRTDSSSSPVCWNKKVISFQT